MTGVAAIAFCAAFTSCSKSGDELYNPEQIKQNEIAQVYDSYNRAFIASFGQPGANQDWGFGSAAGTRGSNDNKNQWGNPNYGNWQVPPVLSDGQILRVKTYFQQNPNLTYVAPNYSTYFVQQVYKGYSSPNNDFSKEIYKPANSSTASVVGSGHMDKLTVGAGNVHVDNFNYGTYNGGTGLPVLNTGATDDSKSENFHTDMITLIEDVRPTCVGFNESESSYQHNDHAALVSAATIDAWIEAKYGQNFGAKCVDGWNRDFVGLDYEATPADGTYVRDGNNNIIYAKISDYDMGKTLVWDGTNFQYYNDVKDNILTTPNGVTFPVVSSNKNQYLGEYVKIDQNNLVSQFTGKQIMDNNKNIVLDDKSETRKWDVLDLTKIFNAMGTGGAAAVKDDKGGFVKNFGGRDYYFSDWIVTLTPAKKQDTPPSVGYDFRVIAEDLNAKAITDLAAKDGLEESDWDFNDVVFDVRYKDDNTAIVKVKVVGGVLPLYIGNSQNPKLKEVHQLFGQTPDANGQYTIIGARDSEEFEVPGVNKSQNGIDIKISVGRLLSTGEDVILELMAKQGVPAAKIRVKPTFEWCAEREDIRDKYKSFSTWVQNSVPTMTWE